MPCPYSTPSAWPKVLTGRGLLGDPLGLPKVLTCGAGAPAPLRFRQTSMPEPTVAYRICPLCEACCGLAVELRDGRVAAIRGDREDVFSAGYLCPKGVALKELHEDPDRLLAPLVKRDGRFAAASWEEAFAEIERRLPPILARSRSEEHTSELQSRLHLVCRLLLEKKKTKYKNNTT